MLLNSFIDFNFNFFLFICEEHVLNAMAAKPIYWDDVFFLFCSLFSSTPVLKKRFIFNFVLNPPADIQFSTFTVFKIIRNFFYFLFLLIFYFYFHFNSNKIKWRCYYLLETKHKTWVRNWDQYLILNCFVFVF